jgi:HEAT repeat protein
VTHAATGAIHALGSAATPILALQSLASPHSTRRRHALRIIAYLGVRQAFDAVVAAIEDPDARIAELAVAALAALDDPRIDAILLSLAHRPEQSLRAAAMRAASHRGGDAMAELLLRGLADDAGWVRYYACQGLGAIRRNEATAALIGRLADAVPHVRIAAIEALSRLETPQAWQALASSARSEDPDARRAALVGIGHQPRPAALSFLIEAASSADIATQLIALAGLARSVDPRGLAPLVAAARGQVVELRDAALSLLADRNDRAAADALVDAALESEPDHPVQRALSRPAGPWIAAITSRLATADDRAAPLLVAALARVNATETLFATLAAPSAASRRAAANALMSLDAEGAREAVQGLASSDPDPDVRSACRAAVQD